LLEALRAQRKEKDIHGGEKEMEKEGEAYMLFDLIPSSEEKDEAPEMRKQPLDQKRSNTQLNPECSMPSFKTLNICLPLLKKKKKKEKWGRKVVTAMIS
jgi:hypothetical protein